LVYLIIVLVKLHKILNNVGTMLNENTQNINTTLNNLPNVVETFGEVGENMKDVTEVVTEVTADFLVTKDSVKSNMDVIVDILTIIKNIFLDKK
ncbi:TPA: hypothetical protein ACKOTO_001759, partial [Clostridioides difficile]